MSDLDSPQEAETDAEVLNPFFELSTVTSKIWRQLLWAYGMNVALIAMVIYLEVTR